ncbi:hypothetical protein, partial [Klebsiella pneumoniae]|uniref:hypothetical protein n=1 Tax=Klebsiella pneumoniae TaxID=573 RepID=UPI003B5C09E6
MIDHGEVREGSRRRRASVACVVERGVVFRCFDSRFSIPHSRRTPQDHLAQFPEQFAISLRRLVLQPLVLRVADQLAQ